MTVESHSVSLLHQRGNTARGIFYFDPDEDDDDCHLTLTFEGSELTARSSDYFEAMSEIRRKLESEGWQLICNGSSRNVFPSGMSRDMGSRGQLAYKLSLGVAGKTSDLVDIFECETPIDPVSVDEQLRFYEQWIDSLSRRKQ